MSSTFPQTKENTIRIYKDRARYEKSTIRTILDHTFVSNVSFVTIDEDGEPTPNIIPMTAVPGRYDPSSEFYSPETESISRSTAEVETNPDDGFDVYLHGNAALALNKLVTTKKQVKVCISSTKVDGVILHFRPNGHSLNYRSCVLHGNATPVTSPAEKLFAMRILTNHMVANRWESSNEVAESAMKSVQIMKVVISSASAKVRASNIGAPKTGMGERSDVWTGAIPMWEVLGEPVGSDGFGEYEKREVQEEVREWIEKRNEREREYAVKVANTPI